MPRGTGSTQGAERVERPQVVAAEVRPLYKDLRRIFTTTHHTDIGILYLTAGFLNFILAGLVAGVMRATLTARTPPISPSLYASLFTVHGTAMIFLAIVPISVGFANYLLPKMVGAPDMYWPKLNAFSFWLVPPASLLIWLGMPAIGWTGYAPLSVIEPGIGVDMWILGLHLLSISSIAGGLNFLMTVFKLRAPDLPLSRVPLFVWSMIATSFLLVAAIPALSVGLTLLLFDRNLGTSFFVPKGGGDALLWQHVFWFFGHPEVYILVLPAMGLVSEMIPRFAKRPIYGFRAIAMSSLLITIKSFGVWVHHMFTTGLSIEARIPFMAITMAIAIPSGIKVFNWTATLYDARISFKAPMLFALGFVATFLVGGITGVFLPVIPVDYALQDSYFVLGHFHFVVFGIILALVGATYYYFPYMTGRRYSEPLALISFANIFLGSMLTFTSMLALGVQGMPRRYYQYASVLPGLVPLHQLATVGYVFMAVGFILFFHNLVRSLRRGERAAEDPWGAMKMGLPDFHIPRRLARGAEVVG